MNITSLQAAAPTRSSSSTSSGQTAQEMTEILSDEYRSCLGNPMPIYLKKAVEATLDREGEDDFWYLMYALREASKAPRPSWAYARAVYYRVKREGVNPGFFVVECSGVGPL